MLKTFATVFAAAFVFASAAQAATVKDHIAALISAKAQQGGKSSKAVLLPLKTNATTYAEYNGIAGLEAQNGGDVQVWGTGGMMSLTYWTDATRTTVKTLGCNQNYSKTTCEIR